MFIEGDPMCPPFPPDMPRGSGRGQGTGKVLVYADSPTGRSWRRHFPESQGLWRGLVAQSVESFLRRNRRSIRDAARDATAGGMT